MMLIALAIWIYCFAATLYILPDLKDEPYSILLAIIAPVVFIFAIVDRLSYHLDIRSKRPDIKLDSNNESINFCTTLKRLKL